MIEVQYSSRALNDVERLSHFLLESAAADGPATAEMLFEAIDLLANSPEIGRRGRAGNRELVISRGSTGYLALYRFLPDANRVLILTIRHQREAGYKSR